MGSCVCDEILKIFFKYTVCYKEVFEYPKGWWRYVLYVALPCFVWYVHSWYHVHQILGVETPSKLRLVGVIDVIGCSASCNSLSISVLIDELDLSTVVIFVLTSLKFVLSFIIVLHACCLFWKIIHLWCTAILDLSLLVYVVSSRVTDWMFWKLSRNCLYVLLTIYGSSNDMLSHISSSGVDLRTSCMVLSLSCCLAIFVFCMFCMWNSILFILERLMALT